MPLKNPRGIGEKFAAMVLLGFTWEGLAGPSRGAFKKGMGATPVGS